jgi:thymidylate synthase (FAD)
VALGGEDSSSALAAVKTLYKRGVQLMRIVSEPQIYLVGRQSLDHDEVQRFLKDHETSWQTDSENGSELIVELAGRTCFDAETEVLTSQGWKLFAHLDQTEEVLTLNPQTHFVEFQKPLAYQVFPYRGMLKSIEGRDISFAVTPDHRQYGRFAHHAENEFVPTSEVAHHEFRIVAAGSGWSGHYPDAVSMEGLETAQRISNQFGTYGSVAIAARPRTFTDQAQVRALAMLLTYYVTEGSLRDIAGSGQGIVIYGDHEDAVRELCQQLDCPMHTYTDPRNGVLRMAVGGGATLRSYCEEQCGKGSENKRLPGWVLNLPIQDLACIWNILVATDGHKYKSGREILCTTSKILAGQAQEILCKLGFSSRTTRVSEGVNFPVYFVSRKLGRNIVLNMDAWVEDQPYDGMVYCVTTPNGIIYVRRNGKPHFSGNCYMSFGDKQFRKTNADYVGNLIDQGHGSVLEHAVFDLLITGVSRSLTHELVRHRSGTGFSQLSQRYVDESIADFVEPPIIAEDPELHEIWQQSVQASHIAYMALVEKLSNRVQERFQDLPKTQRRKMAREAARSVLPNATETKVLFSANARALRWIITLRGGEGAEPEIRRLAVKLARLMQQEAPNLFNDFEIVPLADGTEGVKVLHQKV